MPRNPHECLILVNSKKHMPPKSAPRFTGFLATATDTIAHKGKIMLQLSAGLMKLGAALCMAPVVALVLLRTAALLPLMPLGIGIAALGLLVALVHKP